MGRKFIQPHNFVILFYKVWLLLGSPFNWIQNWQVFFSNSQFSICLVIRKMNFQNSESFHKAVICTTAVCLCLHIGIERVLYNQIRTPGYQRFSYKERDIQTDRLMCINGKIKATVNNLLLHHLNSTSACLPSSALLFLSKDHLDAGLFPLSLSHHRL